MNRKQSFRRILYSKKVLGGILAAVFLLSDVPTGLAGAVSVVESVQNTADSLRNKAKEISYKRNNTVYLAQIQQWIEGNKVDWQKALADEQKLYEELATAQKDLLTAKEQWAEVQQKATLAAQYLIRSGYDISEPAKLISQIQVDIAYLHQAEKAAQALAIAKQSNVEAELKSFNAQIKDKKENLAEQILANIGYKENDLEDAEVLLDQVIAKENAIFAAKEQAGSQQIKAAYDYWDSVSKQLAEAYKQQEAAYLVQDEVGRRQYLTAMENYVTSLKNDIINMQAYIQTLQKNYDQLTADKEIIQKQLQPIDKASYITTQSKLYSWYDNKGKSGQQFYQPIGFYKLSGTNEFAVYSGYLNSRVNGGGSVSGLMDINIYLGKIARRGDYTWTYMLNVNLPTGHAASPANSIVSDDLVEKYRLGEGWNWMPGLRVSKQIGEEDAWIAEVRYNIRGAYQYDSNLPDVKVNPGDELVKTISWQHIGQSWQFLGTISHVNYTKTKENILSYREGDHYDVQATYNKVLSEQDDLMVYYWYAVGNKTDYYSPLSFEPGGGLYRHYIGTQWQRKLNDKARFSVMFNTMLSTGNNYDPLTYLSVTERNKYGLRLGYTVQLSAQEYFAFHLERFYMYDKNQSITYRGNNFYLTYSKSL